ncbi:MAG: hypothetical protein R3C61_19700 [Bacteroidia bacterium]
MFIRFLADDMDLVEDFVEVEIVFEREKPGRAKFAGQRAARLGGDAGREAVGSRDEYPSYLFAIGGGGRHI